MPEIPNTPETAETPSAPETPGIPEFPSHVDDVKALLNLPPDQRPTWFTDLLATLTPTPETAETPGTPGTPGIPESLPSHPDKIRETLALPRDQWPDWLTDFVGTWPIPPIPADSTNPLLDIVMANTARQDCTLTFPLPKVLAAAEHAATAPEHRHAYDDKAAGIPASPQLWWVKDDGTYLMSNGIHPDDTRAPNGNLPEVVHAEGWGPGTDPRSILGGDDFSHPFGLLTPEDGEGTAILDMLRDAAADGATLFLLNVIHGEEGMYLGMTTQ